MRTTVGRPIQVGEVLSRSRTLLFANPVLLVPQAIVLVISLLEDIPGGGTISVLRFVLELVSIIVTLIVGGAYPSLVQAALKGGPIDVMHALRHAASRFWTLLIAAILVGIIVILGFVALIVPGIILACWYIYTIPVIMLENKGALDGMSASKAFGRDKKWSTFSLLIVIIVVAIIADIIGGLIGLGSALAGRIVTSILEVPVQAWASVIFTYTYITYGPSSTLAPAPGTIDYGTTIPPPPPASPQQPVTVPVGAPAAEKRFCPSCGSPVNPDAKFCPNCGQAL